MPSDVQYPSKLTKALNDLRKQNQLCDIVINIGMKSFHAHRAVLVACSSYFMAMFTSGFKESTQREVQIDGEARAFEILLQFAYTGELKITPKTAYSVLEMACYMQITDAFALCCNFIQMKFKNASWLQAQNRISIGDVFKISQLARNHECLKQLVKESDNYVEYHIQELKETEVFLQDASVAFLEAFLSRKELLGSLQEKQILHIIVRWLKYDWKNRCTYSHCLLQKVRLGLVPAKDLKQLINQQILKMPGNKALLDRVLQLQSSRKPLTTLLHKFPKLFAARSTVTAPICSGPRPGAYDNRWVFCYYHTQKRLWKHLRKMPCLSPSMYHSLIVVKGVLYAAGGCHKKEESLDSDWDSDFSDLEFDIGASHFGDQDLPVFSKMFLQYQAEENKWIQLPSMNKARHRFHLVYLDGFIYAIAGSNDAGDLISDVERYDMAKNKWQVVPSISEGYKWITAIAFRGKILAYGISADNTRSPQSCEHVVQVYHPDTGTWKTMLREQYKAGIFSKLSTKPPVLFIHNDVCYRVLYRMHRKGKYITKDNSQHKPLPKAQPKPQYKSEDSSSDSSDSSTDISYIYNSWQQDQPLVNALELPSQDDVVKLITVGEELKQDLIPPYNKVGAFRIHNEVFVNAKGFIHKTDLEIKPDQQVDVNLYRWEGYNFGRWDSSSSSNIAYFTFDRKRLER